MILAYNKKTQTEKTFENENMFNLILDIEPDTWELRETNVKEEPVENLEVIEVVEIIPDVEFNIKDYSVRTFREGLKDFTNKELKLFLKDSRQTIVRESEKELRNR
jgi:hypothetical protein